MRCASGNTIIPVEKKHNQIIYFDFFIKNKYRFFFVRRISAACLHCKRIINQPLGATYHIYTFFVELSETQTRYSIDNNVKRKPEREEKPNITHTQKKTTEKIKQFGD